MVPATTTAEIINVFWFYVYCSSFIIDTFIILSCKKRGVKLDISIEPCLLSVLIRWR